MKIFVIVLTATGPALCVEIGKLVYRIFSLAHYQTFGWWVGMVISVVPIWFILSMHDAYFEYKDNNGDENGKTDAE